MKLKTHLKDQIKKLPGIRKIVRENQNLKNQLEEIRHNAAQAGSQLVDYRLQLKKINKQKINVVFACHRPAVWESLHSVYDALKSDNVFNIYIVAIPNKKELPKLGFNHDVYESEGAEEFWENYDCINGYNYETKKWYDLRQLDPDYVFFQQPYNITRCEEYKSWNVALYAKICYVHYAYDFIGNGVLEETNPKDFISDVSYYFTQNSIDNEMIKEMLKNYSISSVKTVITGFPRYDNIEKFKKCSTDTWNFAKKGSYRVMWTPRWCTNEGNCSFFDNKDAVVQYALNHEDVALLFRPHPQAFKNWVRTGELTEDELNKYIEYYKSSENMRIDSKKEYFDTIFNSDCLISDASSFIADYFMTGKPIIYCHKIDMFNELSRKMSEGFYWAKNWEEVEKILNNLKTGKDELKEKRLQILRDLNVNNQNAGKMIADILKYNNSTTKKM